MKKYQRNKIFSLSWIGGLSLLVTAPLHAAPPPPPPPPLPLDLSNSPLFLGNGVNPNVFVELDDSSSMDWEILTPAHWEACVYDVSNPASTSCPTDKVIDGFWRGTINSSGSLRGYTEIFSNSDDYWGSSCDNSNPWYNSIAKCSYITDSTIITNLQGYNQYHYAYDWRARSSDLNVQFFDPSTDYKPWPGQWASASLTDASFTSARSNPLSGHAGYSVTKNLSTINNGLGFIFEVWLDGFGFSDNDADPSNDRPRSGTAINRTVGNNGIVDLWDDHVRFTVTQSASTATVTWRKFTYTANATSGVLTPTVTDGSFSGTNTETTDSTVAAAIGSKSADTLAQNIANWYQYHRRRSFMAKAAISDVVLQSPGYRFGLGYIKKAPGNTYNAAGLTGLSTRVNMPSAATTNYTTHNTDLIKNLYASHYDSVSNPGGTPLRTGFDDVVEYFRATSSSPITEACQQNFTILFTDGHYNNDETVDFGGSGGAGDKDGDGFSYRLSDIAYYARHNDLNTTLADRVPNPDDPNPDDELDQTTHQFLTTIGVVFGVDGTLTDTNDDDRWPNPALESDDAWGPAFTGNLEDPAKIDDLWHAAFNGSGLFISAKNPKDVVDGLADALILIKDRTSSATALAATTGQLVSETQIFQAQFDSNDWSGKLTARNIEVDASGNLSFPEAWPGKDKENFANQNWSDRTIFTINSSNRKGVNFTWPASYTSPNASTEISSSQITSLLAYAPYAASTSNATEIAANQLFGGDLISYFRGNPANEGAGRNFRRRSALLGDIINSNPFYVGAPFRRYTSTLESESYPAFRLTNKERMPVIYVGANDGMLHGFATLTKDGFTAGDELFAFVPGSVYGNLPKLSRTDYTHRFFADGPVIVEDAYSADFDGVGKWRTVLAGGLRAGGQSVYALDITDPTTMSTVDILWEFTDTDTLSGPDANGDPAMGYSFAEPSIVKMANGQWVAIFGNGYSNTTTDSSVGSGTAVLFIVDIATGKLVKKIDTGVSGTSRANGLSTPAAVDIDSDFKIDYIYAGDMEGNLWKFNVKSSSPNSWDVAYKQSSTNKPLFSTSIDANNDGDYTDSGDVAKGDQPITARPAVTEHTDGGLIVLFGTGQYLEVGDNSSSGQPTQAVYGVIDPDVEVEGEDIASFELSTADLPYRRSNLLAQTIDHELPEGNPDVIITSDNELNISTHKGWYLDLIEQDSSDNKGEKQVTDMLISDGKVVFTTMRPSPDVCGSGGIGVLWSLDANDGSRPDAMVFDLNGDGEFTGDDLIDNEDLGLTGVIVSAVISDNILSEPIIVRDPQHDRNIIIAGDSKGEIIALPTKESEASSTRQSWQDLSEY